jgi:hypothetical protein
MCALRERAIVTLAPAPAVRAQPANEVARGLPAIGSTSTASSDEDDKAPPPCNIVLQMSRGSGPPSASGADALERVPALREIIASKYEVERVLGVGGMGVVIAARHMQLAFGSQAMRPRETSGETSMPADSAALLVRCQLALVTAALLKEMGVEVRAIVAGLKPAT